jgi:hypothetical protein
MLPPSLLVVTSGRAPLVGPTAAVERAHSDCARSGSNGLTGVSFRPFVLGRPNVRMSGLKLVLWGLLAVLGSVALAFVVGLVNPQEKVNGLWLVVAAACIYVLAGE